MFLRPRNLPRAEKSRTFPFCKKDCAVPLAAEGEMLRAGLGPVWAPREASEWRSASHTSDRASREARSAARCSCPEGPYAGVTASPQFQESKPPRHSRSSSRGGPTVAEGLQKPWSLAATPALAVVRQWRRRAAAAFRAGCARGSSPAEDARRAPAGREAL